MTQFVISGGSAVSVDTAVVSNVSVDDSSDPRQLQRTLHSHALETEASMLVIIRNVKIQDKHKTVAYQYTLKTSNELPSVLGDLRQNGLSVTNTDAIKPLRPTSKVTSSHPRRGRSSMLCMIISLKLCVCVSFSLSLLTVVLAALVQLLELALYEVASFAQRLLTFTLYVPFRATWQLG